MTQKIHFLLNDSEFCATSSPGTLVLDYLRRIAHQKGTKEGCREGDCGACAVLLGEFDGTKVHYKSVPSCLLPLGEIHGKHLVTIEGLNGPKLSPVQQAIVDEGATQCGFCTPGIVVSLTGYLLDETASLDAQSIKKALSGHLCRCTGYASLKQAGGILLDQLSVALSQAHLNGNRLETLIAHNVIPEYFRTVADRLHKIAKVEEPEQQPEIFIAGGTDLYVQKGEMIPQSPVAILNLSPHMKGVSADDSMIHVGALTTFEEFANNAHIQKIVPHIGDYMHLIASLQVRNRATVAGNLVNASPIADMTVIFLALQSTLQLQNSNGEYCIPLDEFYLGYKKLAKAQHDIVTTISFPIPDSDSKIDFEKVSKRKCLDIATVNSAIKVRCQDGLIADVCIAMGGVAPISLVLRNTCAYLCGQPINKETLNQALTIAQSEISPISDIRGSADYRRLLVRQFLVAHFSKLYPQYIYEKDFL